MPLWNVLQKSHISLCEENSCFCPVTYARGMCAYKCGRCTCNQLARVTTWLHTQLKLGTRHRKESAIPRHLECEGCSIKVKYMHSRNYRPGPKFYTLSHPGICQTLALSQCCFLCHVCVLLPPTWWFQYNLEMQSREVLWVLDWCLLFLSCS